MNLLRTFLSCVFIFFTCALSAQEKESQNAIAQDTAAQTKQFDQLIKNADERRTRIDEWLDQLESNDFSIRQSASDELTELMNSTGLEHYPYLASKVNGLSRDAKMRIRKILKQQDFTGKEYTLRDGEGEVIPNAICEFFLIPADQHNFTLDGIELLGRTFSDTEGKIVAPLSDDRRTGIKVFSPDYGTVGAILASHRPDIFLPVVKHNSPAAKRAVVGVLQDEQGTPLASLPVSARSIRIKGVGSYATRGQQTAAITDRLGRFRLYAEPSKSGQVVPLGATFNLVIESNSIFPMQPFCNNDQKHVLTVPTGKHFHRFEFEGIETRKLIYAQVYYRGLDGKSKHVLLSRNFITSGGKLLAGHYEATVAKTNFKSIIVTADSPETIVFEPQGNKTYSGKVLNGRTGEPMRDAVVFAFDASVSGTSLADMTNAQWQELAATPVGEMQAHPACRALKKIKAIQAIGKTDASGSYSITTKESQDAYGLIAMASGMLPYEVRARSSNEKNNRTNNDSPAISPQVGRDENHITVGTMYLFPAARVRFQAVLPQGVEFKRKQLSVWPEWEIDESEQPDWFDKFQQAKESRHGIPGFYPAFYHAKIGSINELFVPADIGLRINLTSSTTNRLAPYRVPDLVRLEPGRTKDLKRIKLAQTYSVVVHVVGPDGAPLHGIPIRHRYETSGWHLAKLSNAEGKATLHVAAKMPGQFGVTNFQGSNGRIKGDNLTIPVEIDGATDKVFTIEFTKEQVALLPNPSS